MKLWIEVPENTEVIKYTYVHERDNGDTLQISEARLNEQEIADHVVEEAENRRDMKPEPVLNIKAEVDKIIEERLGRVSNLDSAIANTAYILDSLCVLRDLCKTGCCNDCAVKRQCRYAPDCGKIVRYNCPFYERSET